MTPGKAKKELRRRLAWVQGRPPRSNDLRSVEIAALNYAIESIDMRKASEERARLDQHHLEASTMYHDDASTTALRLDQLAPGYWL